MGRKKIVIIGGGFGGLNAAKKLKHADVDITLIDKTNHHLFQPLLYQVATAALSPGDIAIPIRGILSSQKNITVLLSRAEKIDRANKIVHLDDGELNYDYLIVATGNSHSYFGNDKWGKYAPGLKTVSDALTIRENILLSFEKAEKHSGSENIDKYMTFVIVGGGPTGVEMAGAIAEIACRTMLKDFRNIDPAKAKIILVEGADKILGTYDEPLNNDAREALEALGVEVRLNTMVTDVKDNGVQLNDEFIETNNIIWAAGNEASPLIKSLDTETDNAGRAMTRSDCTIKEDDSVFVIGDAANFKDDDNNILPGVAQVAIQQGKYVADIIAGETPAELRKPFKYNDKGNMATIGITKAVLQIGKFKLSGFFAWLLWSIVHIMYLISYRNRYRVMLEWFVMFITKRRGIRLITHQHTDRNYNSNYNK